MKLKAVSKFYLDFMGEDFVAVVEYEITSRGYKGDWYDPPEGPEWEVKSIHLRWDEKKLGAPFEATGALFDALCDNLYGDISEAAGEAVDVWDEP